MEHELKPLGQLPRSGASIDVCVKEIRHPKGWRIQHLEVYRVVDHTNPQWVNGVLHARPVTVPDHSCVLISGTVNGQVMTVQNRIDPMMFLYKSHDAWEHATRIALRHLVQELITE